MKYGLTSLGSVVGDDPIIGKALFSSNLFSPKHQRSSKVNIARIHFRDRGDGFLGNHQNMNRRLRIDVLEGENFVVFVDDIGRYFSVYDFLEDSQTSLTWL